MPEKVPQARFCFWLREKGYLDAVRSAVEAEGSRWLEEPPSARKDDASPFEPAGGLMEQINASIQRGCSI